MMTAKIKLNTKRADACRPATSAPRKQSLHTEEEEGVRHRETLRSYITYSEMPSHIILPSDNKNRLKEDPRG